MRFKINALLPWIILFIVLLGLVRLNTKSDTSEQVTDIISSGDFQVWSIYDGTIESRTVRNIMSELWNATVIDIIPDGSQVKKNEVLLRFDASSWEKDLPRVEREYTMARSDLDSLIKAKLPLELSDIENRLNDSRQKFSEETQAMSDNRELFKENLISEKEVKQQETKTDAAKALADSLQQQLELTGKYLHPSVIERAKATLASAETEFNRLQMQISNCVVRAPADGMVIYKIIPIGSEVRTIRAGDTVYRNQTIMTVPDMSNLIMRCDIPESDITMVRPGNETLIQALAYPELTFKGYIESIGLMAQTVPGRPSGRKYFSVMIRVDNPDDRLKCGMSARARILSYSKKNAILIPRTAVWWEASHPMCKVQRPSNITVTVLKTGMANDTHFEVFEGIKPGDRVVVR